MEQFTTTALPLLPVPGGVIVPQMVVTVGIDSDEAQQAVEAARNAGRHVLLVPRVGDRYARVGTVARIEQDTTLPDGHRAVVVRGLARARVGAGQDGPDGALFVGAIPAEETGHGDEQVAELTEEYRAVVSQLLDRRGASQVAEALKGIAEPGALADTAVYSPDLSVEQKVEVLETVDVAERLRKVLAWAKEALAESDVIERVQREAHDSLNERQKEAVLREQMAAIRKELGEEGEGDLDDYRERIAALPDNVREAAERELGRLERTSEQSPEHGWIRTWLDTVLEVPWNERTTDLTDLDAAREVLDADHTGLEDVKRRLVEFLAVRRLRAERGLATQQGGRRGGGAILALVGPPGVGKTSLGESVARALGRNFARVSLGGVHDEAEIRGHRRTYVGAQPGRIVRALTDAGSLNPVMVLDEVDKVGSDFRGDPTAALLEVLDPAQNHTFRDHYLEVELDLSDVVFLATGNVLETIPAPLRDRLEIIHLDGYTHAEKVEIARQHLLPRQRRHAGLSDEELELTDEALEKVVEGWTSEAGVRELERQLGRIARRVATELASGQPRSEPVEAEELRDLLGSRTHRDELTVHEPQVGVATGLAVTGVGGDVLAIEASAADGEEGIAVTGRLGDVMRESAELAHAFVRSHATELGVDPARMSGRRIHLHVPAGAIPKDGPSAGIAITTALVSLLRGEAPRAGVGMTGEVTLTGRVLPVGGIKGKLLAAHRAGLSEVIIPAANAEDLDELPDETREALTVHLARTMDDVTAVVLPQPAAAGAAAEAGAAA